DRFGEVGRLHDRILTIRGVKNQQHFVRSPGNYLSDHTVNLFEFTHQVCLRVQSAGSIDDDDVRLTGQAGGTRIVRHGGRVASGRAFDDLDANAIGPLVELLNGSGAKGVTCAQQHFFTFRVQP